MLADLATKALASPRHRELLQLLEMHDPMEPAEVVQACKLHDGGSSWSSGGDSIYEAWRAMGVKTLVLAVSMLALATSKITIVVEDPQEESYGPQMWFVVGALLMALAVLALRRWYAKISNRTRLRGVRRDSPVQRYKMMMIGQ